MPVQKFSDCFSGVPALMGRCTIDVWHPWARKSLEAFARRNVQLLGDEIEKHREAATADIRHEILQKVSVCVCVLRRGAAERAGEGTKCAH